MTLCNKAPGGGSGHTELFTVLQNCLARSPLLAFGLACSLSPAFSLIDCSSFKIQLRHYLQEGFLILPPQAEWNPLPWALAAPQPPGILLLSHLPLCDGQCYELLEEKSVSYASLYPMPHLWGDFINHLLIEGYGSLWTRSSYQTWFWWY